VRLILLIISVLLLRPASAEEIRFSVNVSASRISLQDYLQVQYLVENTGRVSQFLPPEFRSFDVIEGPDREAGVSVVNGNSREYISFSYLLKPRKEGKFFIPSATVRIDGKTYRTRIVAVEVSGAIIPGLSEGGNFAPELLIRQGETIAGKVSGNLFVRIEVDKTSCFEGEPVVATYKLYTRMRSESKVTKRPAFNGFSVHDMINPESEESLRETFRGKDYNVYLLRKVQLYPLQPGEIVLDPVEVENRLTFIKAEMLQSGYDLNRVLRSLAEEGLDPAIVQQTVAVESEPVTISVKPLPASDVSGFNGAVGSFQVRTMLSNPVVHKNDLVNLVVTVSGKGNFPLVQVPQISWPDSTEVFELSVQEQFSKFVSPIAGAKLFHIPFIVQKEGDITIPAVDLPFFDPATARYAVAHSEPLVVHVEPVVEKPRPVPAAVDAGNSGSFITWAVVLLAIISVAGSLYILLHRGSTRPGAPKPVPPQVPQAAADVVQDPLENIRRAFESGDSYQFYMQLGIVIEDCMRRKYGVDDRGNWENGLLQKGVDPVVIDSIRELKKDTALAMYTPFVMESRMVEDLSRIEKLVCG